MTFVFYLVKKVTKMSCNPLLWKRNFYFSLLQLSINVAVLHG